MLLMLRWFLYFNIAGKARWLENLLCRSSSHWYSGILRFFKIFEKRPWTWYHKHTYVKLCGKSITKSLEIIYNKCLERGWFPVEWKKTVVPVHKKSGKQLIQNYQPISLLPIWGKSSGKVIVWVINKKLLDHK